MTVRPKYVYQPPKRQPQGFIVSPKHRVLWKASQVEYSTPCYRQMKVGDRVGVCEHRGEDRLAIPKGPVKFWTGTVEEVRGDPVDPLVTITFDDADAVSITFGVKQYAQFCIFLPDQKKRPKKRRTVDG